jgi:succinate dehydrogenase flavin-adding protein (antitoxin of CptAB toxin-antitoxin module)
VTAKNQYYAVQNALKPFERALIDYYELCWFTKNSVPSPEEVLNFLRKSRPNIKLITINYSLARRPVRAALTKRGIPFENYTREDLTAEQQAAALTVMNFADERSIADKLDQIGVLPATYYSWLNDPKFKNFVNQLAEQNLNNIKPTVVAEFTKLINKGDWNALKYYMDNTRTLANEAPQSEQMLRMIIEIIQRHVKDPQVMMSIAQDLINVTQVKTIDASVTEEYTYDSPQVEQARHALGY